MTTTISTASKNPVHPDTPRPTRATEALLIAGAAAAPLFVVVSSLQAALRSGFDLMRHPVSMLANGDLGWIQTTTFLLTGALTLGCAVGMRRVLRGGHGGGWGPILLAVQGAGMCAAGIFRLDPADGFPPGTPAGQPASMTWHSMLHNMVGSLSFLALIMACFVLSRRFAAVGQRWWAACGRLSATAFAIGLGWALSGARAGSLSLFIGITIAWAWTAVTSARLAHRPVAPSWQT